MGGDAWHSVSWTTTTIFFFQVTEENLSDGMRELNGCYTQRFNKNHERVGHILQGRYHSELVEGEAYFLEVVRYVILNPVRAGVVPGYRDWLWSSFYETTGKLRRVPIDHRAILSAFSGTRVVAINAFEAFLQEGVDQKVPSVPRCGSVIGNEWFVEQVTGGEIISTDENHVVEQKLVSIPTLDELFTGVTASKKERNQAIRFARDVCKYPVTDIAHFLDLHLSTVSRIINECQK